MKKIVKNNSEACLGIKKAYESPKITVRYVELEHSLAATSITVENPAEGQDVKHEWENGDNDFKILNW